MSSHPLQQRILARPRAEAKAGAEAADRFAYQYDWSLCLLLKLDASDDDYVLLCEHLDDVVVLDAEIAPTQLRVYQVKTKDGGKNWKLKDLTRNELSSEGKPLPSILARLCAKLSQFPEATVAGIVSNAPFDIALAAGGAMTEAKEYAAKAASQEIRSQVLDHLANLGLPETRIEDALVFVVSELSLADHEEHAEGKFGRYLSTLAGPGKAIDSHGSFIALKAELSRRSRRSVTYDSYEELIRQKGLSRDAFRRMVNYAVANSAGESPWQTIQAQLRSEGVSFGTLILLQDAWRQMRLLQMNRTNPIIPAATERVRAELRRAPVVDGERLIDTLERVADSLNGIPALSSLKRLEKMALTAGALYEPRIDLDIDSEDASR